MNRGDQIGCIVVVAFGYIIGMMLLGGSLNLLPEKPWLFWLLFLIVTSPIVYAIYRREDISDYFEDRAQRRWKCEHGIRGGVTMEKCARCNANREQRRKELEAKYEKERSQQEFKANAEQLKRSETIRVTSSLIKDVNRLQDMDPYEFEDYIATMFRDMGFNVHQTDYSNDKGKDALLFKDGKKYLVECKKYTRDKSIGRPMLQKFFAAITEEKADGSYFVTTAQFSSSAIAYGKQMGITLINGDELVKMLYNVYPTDTKISYIDVICPECGNTYRIRDIHTPKTYKCENNHLFSFSGLETYYSHTVLTGGKVCKKCGSDMRVVNYKGNKFWGCKRYPTCRYTEPYKKRK